MKLLISLLFPILFSAVCPAQQIVKGLVTDSKSNPLEFVNVAFITTDSTLITGTVTDKIGHFVLENVVLDTTCMLKISFVGYKTVYVTDLSSDKECKVALLKDAKMLADVSVTASGVSQQLDRKVFVPLKIQMEHSNNGLELLDKMQLPGLEVNLLGQSVTSIVANGTVQLRIDNVLATVKDILALEASRIVKIEYIDMPGIRYGRSVAQVVNIITRQTQQGYSGGVNLYNSISSSYGKDGVWAKLNDGKSEFGFRYSFHYTGYDDYETYSIQNLRMTDAEVLDISRQGTNEGYRGNNHALAVTYNWRNTDKNAFHLMFSLENEHSPLYDFIQNVVENGFHDKHYSSVTSVKDNVCSPSLQMNYSHRLQSQQFISAYLVGNYAGSNYRRRYITDEYVSDYTVDGKKYNLYSELNYEKKWSEKYIFSAGYRYNYSRTQNQYLGSTGDVELKMHDHDLNINVLFQGRLGRLGYILGVNDGYQYFKEGTEHYTYNSLMPDITLNYKVNADWNIAFQSSCTPLLPSLAELSEVEQWQNDYEMVRGNASIKPYRTYQNQMTFQYNHKNLLVNAMFYYQNGNHCINQNTVERIGEGDEAYFLYTKSNDSKYTHLQGHFNLRWRLFDNRLILSGLGGVNRHIVKSSQYAHAKTSVFYHLSVNTYIKRWQIGGRFMSAVQSVFNEEFNKTYPTADLHIGYKYKKLLVNMGVMNLFLSEGRRFTVENKSAVAYKYTSTCSRDFGNMLYLTLSWNFSKGSKQKTDDMELRKTNIDTGIVK